MGSPKFVPSLLPLHSINQMQLIYLIRSLHFFAFSFLDYKNKQLVGLTDRYSKSHTTNTDGAQGRPCAQSHRCISQTTEEEGAQEGAPTLPSSKSTLPPQAIDD